MYLSDVISRVDTVAAGSGPRSEGVATARGEDDCGGAVVARSIPLRGADHARTDAVMNLGADANFVRAWAHRRAAEREFAARWRQARRGECGALARAMLAFPGVRRVVLFGSLARGDAGPGSDVDVWIEGLAESDWLAAVTAARVAIADAEVDLVRAEMAGPSLAARVAAEGEVIGER